MALKILSGMIFIPNGGIGEGNVTISFDPFELSEASNDQFELRKARQVGPNGRYIRRPAAIIPARQFSLLFPFPHAELYRVRLDDTVTRDFMTISWTFASDAGRVDQEEIPFMVIGEVPEARTATVRHRPGRKPQRAGRRGKGRRQRPKTR